MRPPGSGSGNGATVLEFGPMFEKVRRSRFKLKVGDAVVKKAAGFLTLLMPVRVP